MAHQELVALERRGIGGMVPYDSSQRKYSWELQMGIEIEGSTRLLSLIFPP